MRSILLAVACAAAVLCLSAAPARAADITFTESGDAGQTLPTAQVPSGTNADVVTSISGTILTATGQGNSNKDADLFKIYISDPANFSATTVGGATFDTQLFLFDEDGLPVYANDDALNVPPPGKAGADVLQSALPNPFLREGVWVGPTQAGCYYLGISGFNYDPTDGSGPVFNNASGPFSPFTDVSGPKGDPGSLTDWIGSEANNTGNYTIYLTGVSGGDSPACPEPASLGLLAIGLALGALRRRKG